MKTKLLFVTLALTFTAVHAFMALSLEGSDGKIDTDSGGGTQGAALASAETSSDIKTIGVDAVAGNPRSHAGDIRIEGVVAKVFADRGAFILIDASEFQACGETGCAQFNVPVLVPNDEFRGSMPKERETVIVTGNLQPEDEGYHLIVQEVQYKGDIILSRTKSPSSAKIQLLDYLPATILANKDALGLTADQVAKLNGIRRKYSGTTMSLQKEISRCQAELVELLEQATVDRAKINREKEEIEELKERLVEEQRSAEEASRSVLTPEQISKLLK